MYDKTTDVFSVLVQSRVRRRTSLALNIQDYNLWELMSCLKCKKAVVQRKCVDCDEHEMLCKTCFILSHENGHRRLHEYYRVICDTSLPQGLQSGTSKAGNRKPQITVDSMMSDRSKKVEPTDDFEVRLQEIGD